jgi:SecD/SecF fusion protein
MASLACPFLLLAQSAAEAEPLAFHEEGWFRVLAAILILAFSFGVGKWLSKIWRMPDYSFRFGLVLFTVIAGVVICAWRWPPKLGIDLKGGVILIYEVAEQDEKPAEPVNMDEMIKALNLRINPGGQKEVVVRKFGERQVEIIIPEVDSHEIELIKKKISTAGLLEFRIVANPVRDERAIELADKSPAKLVYDEGKEPIAKWVTLDPKQFSSKAGMHTRTNEAGETEVLMRVDRYNITGSGLRAYSGHDQVGRPAVDFAFEGEKAVAFGQFTEENAPDASTGFKQQLGIVLDDRLFSAPGLEEAITGRGQIHGTFTVEEVQFLVDILNAGSLPANLDKRPVSETSISPQLGDDTIRNGAITMLVSTLMILVFMGIYYRFSGLVADFAVVTNLVLVVALMITLGAAFTLAGLAGLVLSVGMAVDANVLIYERMREELARGAAMRMAIRNGFSRAMSTIIDSNLTTLLTGVVLYAIGTDQLKGFAITLILGLLLNLFTAVYVARIVFEVAERRRWITELRMMKMFEAPNWDFVRPTAYAIGLSALLIVGGLIAAVSRGEGLFGIDFTGGTSVQIVLDKEHALDVAEVRRIVNPENGTSARLEDSTVSSVGSPDANGTSRYYKIDTSVQDIEEVKSRLQSMFGNRLQVYNLDYSDPTPITATTGAKAASGTEKSPASTTAQTKADPAKPASDSATANAAAKTDTESSKNGQSTSAPASGATQDLGNGDASPSKESADAPGKEKQETSPGESKTSEPQSSIWRFGRPLIGLSAAPALVILQDDVAQGETKASATADSKDEKAQPEPAQSKEPTSDSPPAGESKQAPPDAAKQSEAKASTEPAAAKNDQADATKSDTAPTTKESSTPAAEKALPAATFPKDASLPSAPVPANELNKPAAEPVFAGGSASKLTFAEGINRDALLAQLEEAATALNLQPAQFLLEEIEGTRDELNSRLFQGWNVKTTLAPEPAGRVLSYVQNKLAKTPSFLGANTIGGKVAGHAQVMAIYAILASMVMIVIYVWVRFQNIVFGLAAVVALVHDVLVTVAALAVSYYVSPKLGWAMVDPFNISLDVVAALLTIVGFSINDTIVIFDRIREIKGKSPDVTADMVNKAVNQTLGRTILTSGTVLMVTLILYIWGGQEIHPFAFAMLIGLISGTYSTVYIAAPLVLFLRKPTARQKSVAARGREMAVRT